MKRILAALSLCLPLSAHAGYDFDGTNDELRHAAAVVSGYPFSACLWAKRADTASDAVFSLGVSGTVDNSFQIYAFTGSEANVRVRTTSEVDVATTGDVWTVDATWHHVCVVATSSSDVDVYFDGTKTDGNPALTPAGMNVTMFGENSNDAADFTGSVGQAAVWDVALSGANVTALAGGDNPLAVSASDLVAYWPMTADATDSVGSFDLTATGATFDGADNPTVDDPPAACSGTPAITDVASDESFPATQTNVVITGTDFCAAQDGGSVTLRQNGNSKTLSIDSWSDTSIQVDISGAGMGVVSGLLYGTADIRVTNDAANSDDQAITLEAPSGTEFVELSTPADLTFDSYHNESRVHGGTPALTLSSASQCAWRNVATLSSLDINDDGSVSGTGTGTFDHDCTGPTGSGGSELYVGSYSAHPNCKSGSTIVCQHDLLGAPPLFGSTPITDHVLAVGLAMTSYDVDDYFVAGEGAASARALRQLGATTDTTADLDGAHTNVNEILVTDAVAHASIVKGAWMRIGASGAPVQIAYVNPEEDLIGLKSLASGSNADAIITYANGAGSVSQVTVNSGTGVVSGTPDTDATTDLLVYRWTDASGLIAESLPKFEIDVVTISDQTGVTEATAEASLEALGLDVSTTYVDETGDCADVFDQNATSTLWGTAVELEIIRAVIPDLTGMTEAEAVAAIEALCP
jgi:hypothetical protein